MIIIIEGPDGSGKTTLAKKLAKQTGYELIHMSNPKTAEEKNRMFHDYMDMIKHNRNLILDRCWYSEMVYGPIMRGDSAISYPSMYVLEEALTKRGALLIYCTDSCEKLWVRATTRGEDYITDYAKFSAICDGFSELMSIPHLIPVVKYGYKDL